MSHVYSMSEISDIMYKMDRNNMKIDTEVITRINNIKTILQIKPSKINGEPIIQEQFVATKKIERLGVDKIMDEIRVLLNKISSKTLKHITIELIDKIKTIQHEITTPEFNKIGDMIFMIASTNGFYSELYAKLYKTLFDNFAIFKHVFVKNKDTYKSLFETIECCDPNVDYNRYCDDNKVNERRRSTSKFYISLMNLDILEPNEIIQLIQSFQVMLFNQRYLEDKQSSNVELSENIAILITDGKYKLQHESEMSSIIDQIKIVATSSLAGSFGWTNKIKFKHMDILDKFT